VPPKLSSIFVLLITYISVLTSPYIIPNITCSEIILFVTALRYLLKSSHLYSSFSVITLISKRKSSSLLFPIRISSLFLRTCNEISFIDTANDVRFIYMSIYTCFIVNCIVIKRINLLKPTGYVMHQEFIL
jgi:hypothetical protein